MGGAFDIISPTPHWTFCGGTTEHVLPPPPPPCLRPGFVMLSRALWALFLSILIQNGITNIVDQILVGGGGGGGLLRPPLNPQLRKNLGTEIMHGITTHL